MRVSFLSVRPIVLSLARSTMFTVSSSVSLHRWRPFGGAEHASAINLASAAPSKMRFLAELGGGVLAGQGCIEAFPHQLLARAGDGVDTRVQCFGNLAVAPANARLRRIGLQHLSCGACTLLDQCVEAFPLFSVERYDVSLYGRLFRDHHASPGYRGYRFRD